MKSKGRKAANVVAVQLEPGQVLQRVPGGFIAVGGLNASGKFSVELEPGEKLHEVTRNMKICPTCKKMYSEEDFKPVKFCSKCNTLADSFEDRAFLAGYVVQPAGAPTLSARGVAKLTNRSITWIHKISRRGPLDRLGGLQGYIVNEEGTGWIPKFGTGINGAEVMYYESDIAEWLKTEAPPKTPEEIVDDYKAMQIPEGIHEIFIRLGEEQNRAQGYVTRTAVLRKAKEITHELSKDELKQHYGLERAIQDRDYKFLVATAIQAGWKDNPRRSFNTAAYRRKPRAI